ncbi:MAG: hypothetical protein KTR35_17090, partial [Gammaproteobacteria bacterium]|nr:hypothetical protein [Gammaproteobacteria bacterium]
AQSALSAVGFKEASPNFWIAENPRTEVYLSVISESGDSIDFDKENPPKEINRIDTHVPWEEYDRGYKVAYHRRAALAHHLNWVAHDLQIDQVVASPVGDVAGVLNPMYALEAKAKSSIEMVSSQIETSIQARPKSKIVAKKSNDGRCQWLEKTKNGGWLLGLRSGTVGGSRANVLQFRDKFFELQDEIEGVGSYGALSPDGTKAIVRGSTCRGYECRTALIDIEERKLISYLPFIGPYIWRNNEEFFAIPTPQEYWSNVVECTTDCVSIPCLLTQEFANVANKNEGHLFSVNLNSGDIKCVQDEHLFSTFGQFHQFYRSIAIGQSQDIVFLASITSVAALNVKTSEILWQRELGRYDTKEYFHVVSEIALSPCGKMLAIASGGESKSHPNACVILSAEDGDILMATAASYTSKVTTVDWHTSSWLAFGLSNGDVVLLDLTGSRREFKGSPKGITTARFDEETLIVASAEKQLRVFPLLADETGSV